MTHRPADDVGPPPLQLSLWRRLLDVPVMAIHCLLVSKGQFKYCEWSSGNIHIRRNVLWGWGKRSVCPGHKHAWEGGHTTFFQLGSFRVTLKYPNGTTIVSTYTSPTHLFIDADVEHTIAKRWWSVFALFDCVYSHIDAQGRIVANAKQNAQGHY